MTQTAEILKTPTSAAPESIEKCAELAQLVERFVDTKGEYDERIPGLHMSSLKAPISTPNCFYVLSVGMILKGSKRLLIGGKTYDYEAGSMLVTSIDLPTSYEIGAVSKDNPFVSLSLKLNPAILAELLAEDVSTLKPGEPYGFDAAPEELIEDFRSSGTNCCASAASHSRHSLSCSHECRRQFAALPLCTRLHRSSHPAGRQMDAGKFS